MPRFYFLLFLLMVGSAAGRAQSASPATIAVIERSNFQNQQRQHHAGKGEQDHYRYETFLRPLFVKSGDAWVSITDSLPGTEYLPEKLRLFGNTEAGSSPVNGQIYRRYVEGEGFQYSSIYRIRRTGRPLVPLPESKTRFEHRDITHYAVVATRNKWMSGAQAPVRNLSAEEWRALNDSAYSRIAARIGQGGNWQRLDDTGTYMQHVRRFYSGDDRMGDSSLVSGIRAAAGDRVVQVRLPTFGLHVARPEFSPDGGGYDIPSHLLLSAVLHADGSHRLLFADSDLLAHADWDGDGKEEYLFFSSCFNHYGYVLVYDDFRRYSMYIWTYH